MPKVKLPHNARGWFVTMIASMVGFVAGTIALHWLSKRFK